MSARLELILGKLEGVQPNGEASFMARCPAHDDSKPSLSVSERDGKILLNCFVGCETTAIVQAIGLQMKDLFDDDGRGLNGGAKRKGGGKFQRTVVPEGTYVCRIAGWREKESATEPGQVSLTVRWTITSGKFKGVAAWDRFSSRSEVGLQRLRVLLRAIGFEVAAQGDTEITEDAVIGRFCNVLLEAKERDGLRENVVAFDGYRPAEFTTYDYRDEVGSLLFQVVRLVPKDFRQRRPNGNGGWTWDLQGVRIVPFRLPELAQAIRGQQVWIAEGEKDVMSMVEVGLVATCNPMGAGKWGKIDATAVEAFRGMDVLIVADKDRAGRKHAGEVATALDGVAAGVRVIEVPGDAKDFSDWVAAGGGEAKLPDLIALAVDGKAYRAAQDSPPPDAEQPAAAGEEFALANYLLETEESAAGERQVFRARRISEILSDVRLICDGWPKRMGDSLFIDNEGRVHFLEKVPSLFGFFHSFGPIRWKGGLDEDGVSFVTQNELFETLTRTAPEVSEFLNHPIWPDVKTIQISSRAPRGDSDGSFLETLIRRFNPATDADDALIWALALTPFWGGLPGSRPFLVVTGVDGIGVQETGKTTLVDTLASITGGAFRLRMEKSANGDSISKQLLGDRASRCRVVLLDNISGVVETSELADAITGPWIEGRPAFARQRSRANYFTWAATAVSPELDEDLSSRAYVIQIKPPQPDQAITFREEVDEFVRVNRARLIQDAVSILQGKARFQRSDLSDCRLSRFPAWDREVLACHDAARDALRTRGSRATAANSRSEDVACLTQFLGKKYRGQTEVSMTPQELASAWNEATGRKTVVSWVSRKLRSYMRSGRLPAGLFPISRAHGCPWILRPDELEQAVETEAETAEPAF